MPKSARVEVKVHSKTGALISTLALKDGVYVIGRANSCEIHCEGASNVSRRHAELTVKGSAMKVRDLDSAVGTLLRGKKVDEAEIKAGDVLQIGMIKFEFSVVESGDAGEPGAASELSAPTPGLSSLAAPAPGKLEAELKIFVGKNALPLAQSFAESSALAYGLDSKSALSLALAAEELFMHLCACLPANSPLKLSSNGKGGRANLEFAFAAAPGFDISPFNITAKTQALSEESLSETGLLLAARSVDSFELHESAGGQLALKLVKERRYPDFNPPKLELAEPCGRWIARSAKAEELPLALTALAASGAETPSCLAKPGKTADLIRAGELSVLLAAQPDGFPCGLLAWSAMAPGRALECFGPYPFPAEGKFAVEIAGSLLDAFLASVCKGDAPIVIARRLRPEFAKGRLEALPGGHGKAFFRMLYEDAGSTVWVSPEIEACVRAACSDLYLPRFVSQTDPSTFRPERKATIFTALDRKAKSATLRPVRLGLDAKEAFALHAETLKAEGFEKISCELDLGEAWHCLAAKPLLDAGFKPGVYLPLAGKGDILAMDFNS